MADVLAGIWFATITTLLILFALSFVLMYMSIVGNIAKDSVRLGSMQVINLKVQRNLHGRTNMV